MAFSGPHLAVTNRTADFWWLLLAQSWPQQIVLPSLGGFFFVKLLNWTAVGGFFWPSIAESR